MANVKKFFEIFKHLAKKYYRNKQFYYHVSKINAKTE